MPNKQLASLIMQLTEIDGISSREENVAKFIKKNLEDIQGLKFERDNLGSLAVIKEGASKDSPTIMIMAHMDEVGFILTDIKKDGMIKFTPIGWWWGHLLLGQKLKIVTNTGKEIVGVIGFPPLCNLPESIRQKVTHPDDMYLDIGASSDQEVLDAGIEPGNMIVPFSKPYLGLNNDRIIAKALDNRALVAVAMNVLREVSNLKVDARVIISFSAQEEVGMRGAKSSTFKWTPDIAFAVDVTISSDLPDFNDKPAKLGKGVGISLMDASVLGNVRLIEKVKQTGKKYNVPFVFDWLPYCKTDAGEIHQIKEGVMAMTLSVPIRYVHSHNSIMSLHDLKACQDLLTNFIKDFKKSDLEEIKFKI